MIDFLLLLVFGVCWTWGFRTPFQEGYFLEKIGNFFRSEDDSSPPELIGNWFTKPLFDCPPCMASVHGLIISSVYYSFQYEWMIFKIIGYIVCLCGLNFIIKSIIYPEYE
jgi:hypothetical protein